MRVHASKADTTKHIETFLAIVMRVLLSGREADQTRDASTSYVVATG
jgi:hypothetical protein